MSSPVCRWCCLIHAKASLSYKTHGHSHHVHVLAPIFRSSHVLYFQRIHRQVTLAYGCFVCPKKHGAHRISTSSYPDVLLRLTNGVRCPGRGLRRMFLPSLPSPRHLSPASLIDTSIQRAIDIARESFPELRDVERDRISLEIHVMHSHQRTVEIGRTAWPFLVAALARFDVVDVRVAPPPPPRFMPASSSSAVEPTPHDPETGWPEYSEENAQTDFIAYRAQMPSSLLHPRSHTTRVVVDVVPSLSSQSRYSPRLR